MLRPTGPYTSRTSLRKGTLEWEPSLQEPFLASFSSLGSSTLPFDLSGLIKITLDPARMIKTLLGSLRARVMRLFGRGEICDHHWRPCAISSLLDDYPIPGRSCSRCFVFESLTDDEFYTQFGEGFFAIAKFTGAR